MINVRKILDGTRISAPDAQSQRKPARVPWLEDNRTTRGTISLGTKSALQTKEMSPDGRRETFRTLIGTSDDPRNQPLNGSSGRSLKGGERPAGRSDHSTIAS